MKTEIEGTRQRGRQRKTCWDCVKGNMESFDLYSWAKYKYKQLTDCAIKLIITSFFAYNHIFVSRFKIMRYWNEIRFQLTSNSSSASTCD